MDVRQGIKVGSLDDAPLGQDVIGVIQKHLEGPSWPK